MRTTTKKIMKRLFFVNPHNHQWVRILAGHPTTSSQLSSLNRKSNTINNNNNNRISTHPIQDKEYYRVQVGLTQRGLDDIGDISRVERLFETTTPTTPAAATTKKVVTVIPVQSQQELMRIEHEGHEITSADELYHTVWNTINETVSIYSPIDGFVTPIPKTVGQQAQPQKKDGGIRNIFIGEEEEQFLQQTDDDGEISTDTKENIINDNDRSNSVTTTNLQSFVNDNHHHYYDDDGIIDDDTVLIDLVSTEDHVQQFLKDHVTAAAAAADHMGMISSKSSSFWFVPETDYIHNILPHLPPGKYAAVDD